jgi:hypothetical protein
MRTYADVCGRMRTYADVCGRMLTYADVHIGSDDGATCAIPQQGKAIASLNPNPFNIPFNYFACNFFIPFNVVHTIASAYVSTRRHTSASRIRQHLSAYVSIRQHTLTITCMQFHLFHSILCLQSFYSVTLSYSIN